MFIGHFGVALAAKKSAPRASLGALVAACQLPDLLWPLLLLTGAERVRIVPGDTAVTPLAFDHYPWSHSLLAVAVWAVAAALLYGAQGRGRRAGIAVGLLVLSHWLLDAITHRPDLPLYPGGAARVGLGLWNSIPATLVVEGLIFVFGVAMYARSTVARDRVGRIGFWSLVAFLAVVHVANLLGPPPPNERALAITALSMWLLVFWAAWVDRHRDVRVSRESGSPDPHRHA